MRSGKLAIILMGISLSAGLGLSAQADTVNFNGLGDAGVPNDGTIGGLQFHTDFFQYTRTDASEASAPGAQNGTDVFINGFSTETITLANGQPFTLNSYDIGLSYFTDPTAAVTVTYNYAAGGSSSTTFTLGKFFSSEVVNQANLASVQFSQPSGNSGNSGNSGYIALDNIVFDASVVTTPEPGSIALLVTGSLTGAAFLRRRKARKSA